MEKPWDHWIFALVFVISGIAVIIAWYFYDQSVRNENVLRLQEQHGREMEQTESKLRRDLEEMSRRADEMAQLFQKQLTVVAEKLHFATHEIRNGLDELLKLDEETVKPRDVEVISVQVGIKVVSYLAEFLTSCVGQSVCVCIKILNKLPDKQGELLAPSYEDLKKTVVETMCRSTNTPKARFEQNLHPVAENTAFLDIMYKGEPYFAKSDLIEEAGQKRYSNTTPHWQDHYKTAIVVPIRIQIGTVDNVPGQRPVYDLLAFLCADTKAANSFDKYGISVYADFLMAVGDGFYHYLDLALFYKNKSMEN
jgi:hypothetical protein